jgi:hypothetical protein
MIGSVFINSTQRAQFRSSWHTVTEQAAANSDPQAQQQARQAVEAMNSYVASDSGLAVLIFSILTFLILFFLFFSALGGAVGAAFFGKEDSSRRL